MRLSTWIVLIPTAAITIWLALANRSFVTLSLDPFRNEEPRWAIDLPVFAAIFLGILLGMLIGGFIVWWGQGRWRREARARRREVARLTQSATRGPSE